MKLKLGLILFVLGFLGVLTLLTGTIIPLPDEFAELSPIAVKALTLANPTIMLLVAVLVGTILHDKVNLTVPVISSFLKRESVRPATIQALKFGIPLGLLTGIVIVVIALVFNAIIPLEFEVLESGFQPTLLMRFGYGGITEELLLRFGVMTFIVWAISRLAKKLNNPIYWTGVIVSTLLFAVGHFPVVFASVPAPSFTLLIYVLIGNSVGGLVFGWLYWKKGLESACIAHMFAHVAMVLGGLLQS